MTRARWISTGLIGLALAIAGCAFQDGGGALGTPDPAHSSRNALDWAGTYEGVTPCADCPGIRMRLTLQGDGRFLLSTQYLDRPDSARTVEGTFRWNDAGTTITLDGAGRGQQFRVGEGRLLQLDRDGGVPPWSAPGRVLERQPN